MDVQTTTDFDVYNVTTTNETITPAEEQMFVFILYRVIEPIFFGVITVLGVLGNSLVMYVILTRQKMRTVTNLLLFNLALADLLFVIICPPFTAYQFATSSWLFSGLFGVIVCKLMHYTLNVTVFVSIYTLVLIAIIRFMTVVHNHTTQRIRSRANIILMIIAIWGIMLAGCVPVITYHVVEEIDGVLQCNNAGMDFGRIYYTLFFLLAYLLPFCIIAVFSLCILLHISAQKPTMLESRKNKKSNVRKKKASQLLIIVIVVFAILWLPVHIHLLIAYWGSTTVNMNSPFYIIFSILATSMAYFNSCINPFIYNYASKDFRESFREVVCCIRGRKYADRERSFFLKTEMTNVNGQNKEVMTRLKDEQESTSSEGQNGQAV